jgi:hypothetical protein
MSKNKSNAPLNRKHRKVVPPSHLARIIAAEQAYTDHVNANKVTYPDPDEIEFLNPFEIKKLGFVGHDLEHLGIESMEPQGFRGKGRRNRDRKRNRGRGGNQGNQGGGQQQQGGGKGKPGKKLVDPKLAYSEVRKALDAAGLKPVTNTGDAMSLEWNMEFLDETKVKYYADAYKAIIECADLVYVEECSSKGLEALANLVGYKWACSVENNRGQAVGYIWNPNRYDFTGTPEAWDEIANVQGIPDLRPGWVLRNLRCKVRNVKTNRLVGHWKSMRGGEATTDPVRTQQFELAGKRMGKPVDGCKLQTGAAVILQLIANVNLGRALSDHTANFIREHYEDGATLVDGQWICAGDWNCKIDQKPKVIAGLTSRGYTVVYPNDHTSTQAMGGRLDCFFADRSSGTCGHADPTTGPYAVNTTDQPTVVQ